MELEACSQIERKYSSEGKNELTVWLFNFLRKKRESWHPAGFPNNNWEPGNFDFPPSSKRKLLFKKKKIAPDG